MMSARVGVHVLLLLSAGVAGLAVTSGKAQSGGAQAPAAAPKLAEEQFKNIQLFKGLPADQLIPAMQFMTASLGVECEFCHVSGAFEKDDKKEKGFAREMIKMMWAVNKSNFDGKREVTCYTCHRGARDPIGTPVIPPAPSLPEAAEAEKAGKTQAPGADSLLGKYLSAMGGADALEKITSRVQRGTLEGFTDQKIPIEIYSKAPEKRISIVHLRGGDSITAFDGKTGWLGLPNRTRAMNAAENEAARMDADLMLAANLKKQFAKFSVEPGEKIDGHETWLVIGRNEGQPPLKLYLDRESGLLLRLLRYAESPLGRNPTQIDFADYRLADGIQVPFRWTQARPGGRFTIHVEELQQNVPVDDAKFAMPRPQENESKPPAH